MSAPVWLDPEVNFGIIPNLDNFSTQVQVSFPSGSGNVTLISGELPIGLQLDPNGIVAVTNVVLIDSATSTLYTLTIDNNKLEFFPAGSSTEAVPNITFTDIITGTLYEMMISNGLLTYGSVITPPTGTKFVPNGITLSDISTGVYYDINVENGKLAILHTSLYSPTIFNITGNVHGQTSQSIYNFVLRATDQSGDISDQNFIATVYGVVPIQVESGTGMLPGANLGTYPDGTYLNIQLQVIDSTSAADLQYTLFSGALPSGLSLNTSGQLVGYVNPAILNSTSDGFDQVAWDNENFDNDAINLNRTYSFNVMITDGFSTVFVPYSITIERSDVFENPDTNINDQNLHNPIFLNTTNIGELTINSVSADSYFYYQFQGLDFDNSEIAFETYSSSNSNTQIIYNTTSGIAISNSLATIDILPNNLTLNSNTGWLSGYLVETNASIVDYNFNVRLYKVETEPWDSTINVDYAIELPFSIVNYSEQISIDSLVIDSAFTNFDGKTLVFAQQDNFSNTYNFGNIIGAGISNANVSIGDNPWANVSNNSNVDVSQHPGVWQVVRVSGETNPRTGNNSPFYQLNYLQDVGINARVLADKYIQSSNPLELVNNTIIRSANLVANSFGNSYIQTANINPYQSNISVNMTTTESFAENLVWNTDPNLGVFYPGVPSEFSVQASVINNENIADIVPANVAIYMKVVSATISSPGQGYQVGDIITLTAGIFTNPGSMTVSSIGLNGRITSLTLNNVLNQKYTTIPILTNAFTTGGNGTGAAINLQFGVESVSIIYPGLYNNDVTIGFTSANETSPAVVSHTFSNSEITSISVIDPGIGYTTVPYILINSIIKTIVPAVQYNLISGRFPLGLKLLSNGLIVGRPSFQVWKLTDGTIFDSNTTIFDNTYTFTIRASIGLNQIVQGLTEYNSNIFLDQTFTLILGNIDNVPTTNLYLGFLLRDEDYINLFSALNNKNIVPDSDIYRPNDQYFGIVDNLRYLMAYGLKATDISYFENALNLYHHAKTFIFDNLIEIPAINNDGSTSYSTIALVLRDQFTTINGNSFNGPITINSDGSTYQAYPATQPNMLSQLETINTFNILNQPLWLQNPLIGSNTIGSKIVLPLVYTTPESAAQILFSLTNYFSGTNTLNNITFFTDRYIWDAGLTINYDVDTESFDPNPLTTFDGPGSLTSNLSNTNTILDSVTTLPYTLIMVNGQLEYVQAVGSQTPVNQIYMIDLESGLMYSLTIINGLMQYVQVSNTTSNKGLALLDIVSNEYYSLTIVNGELLITLLGISVNQTTFDSNTTQFFDNSTDTFLNNDEGSSYMIFPYRNFINNGIVIV